MQDPNDDGGAIAGLVLRCASMLSADDLEVDDVDADLLSDLGFESMSLVELYTAIEEFFGVRLLDNDDLFTATTPRTLAPIIRSELTRAGRPIPSDADFEAFSRHFA